MAVIDSGADTTHPDLAGRIVAYRNFTIEVGEDIHGHGTHVATTIAGTGAASNGLYRGVAPDARLSTPPAQGQYVSVRTALADFLGNRMEQTVIHAYSLVQTW